jgi:hypothetical protein
MEVNSHWAVFGVSPLELMLLVGWYRVPRNNASSIGFLKARNGHHNPEPPPLWSEYSSVVQVRLAAGGALACMLEGGPQKAFLAIAEKLDFEKQPARSVFHPPVHVFLPEYVVDD